MQDADSAIGVDDRIRRTKRRKDLVHRIDGNPDDWTRRKGPGFPNYVESRIDRHHGQHERASLRINANGGLATIYSPVNERVGRIDALHSYVFEGFVRTQWLQHDAALIFE